MYLYDYALMPALPGIGSEVPYFREEERIHPCY